MKWCLWLPSVSAQEEVYWKRHLETWSDRILFMSWSVKPTPRHGNHQVWHAMFYYSVWSKGSKSNSKSLASAVKIIWSDWLHWFLPCLLSRWAQGIAPSVWAFYCVFPAQTSTHSFTTPAGLAPCLLGDMQQLFRTLRDLISQSLAFLSLSFLTHPLLFCCKIILYISIYLSIYSICNYNFHLAMCMS